MDLPPIMTPDKVAELFGCEPKTVEDRLRDGTLPGVKIGTGWRLPREALLERLNELALEEASKRRQPMATVTVHRGTAAGGRTPLPRLGPAA